MVRRMTEDDIGLRVLREASGDATQAIDVLAIHGIGAHPDDTWCKNVSKTTEPEWVNWLEKDNMLPDVVPNARIMRYGYESQWFGGGAIRQNASTVAKRMLLSLKRLRKKTPSRPLVFIAHCFGGLVVLKALIDARNDETEWPGIFSSTTGLIFFGTPFRGAEGMSQLEMLEAARREYEDDELQPEVLKILEPHNEFLQDIVDQFGKSRMQPNKAKIACFYELKSSNVGRIVGKQNRIRFVVSESSGCLDLSDATAKFSLSRTHFEMNKFGKPSEEDFETLRDVIEDMVQASHELVSARSTSRKLRSQYYLVPTQIAASKFFGRQDLLESLETFLLNERGYKDKPNTIVLQAMGGQGKSQIALELCRRLRKRCRGVFWLDATSKVSIERSFEEIAQKMTQTSERLLEDTDAKVKFVLETLLNWQEQWLMVYDNYDEPDIFTEIKRFLPDSGQGGIIFTSRHEATKVLGKHIEVPSMTGDGGIELILRDLSDDEKVINQVHAQDIVLRLGGLALAIEQAASYISFNRISLPTFIDEYEKKKKRILEHTREELWEYQKLRDGSDTSESLSAFTTWEMSFDQIERHNETRKQHIGQFLNVVAFLEPSHIGSYLFDIYIAKARTQYSWLEIFKDTKGVSDDDYTPDAGQAASSEGEIVSGWSEGEFWSIVERLRRLSLVQSIAKDSCCWWFSIHPVVRDWLQMRQKDRSSRELAIYDSMTLLSIVAIAKNDMERTYKPTRQQMLAHLDCCLNSSQNIKAFKERYIFSLYYWHHGFLSRSENILRYLLDEKRQILGHIHPELFYTLSNAGDAGRILPCSNVDEQTYGQAIKGQVHLKADYMETADVLYCTAKILRHQERFGEAEKLEVYVMKIRKQLLGEDHPETLRIMKELAKTYRSQGRDKEAEGLQNDVWETMRRGLGEKHPDTLESLFELASTYTKQGRLGEAEDLTRNVIALSIDVLGQDHSNTQKIIELLAKVYQGQGKFEVAEQLRLQIMHTRKKVLGIGHPDTIESLITLANMYERQGRLEKVEHLRTQALDCSIKTLGKDEHTTLWLMMRLGLTYLQLARPREAEEQQVQALECMRRVLGEEHPETLLGMSFLAVTLYSSDRDQDAIALMERCVEMSLRVSGPEHSATKVHIEDLKRLKRLVEEKE